MNPKERFIIAIILLSIGAMTFVDLLTDSKEGVANWHVFVEGLVVLVALIGVFTLVRSGFQLRRSLETERINSSKWQGEAKIWKEQSKKYLQGLSQSIDTQLSKWGLTESEKEVTFLLLKGLSLKEVASVRNTSEKTARSQSTSIYAKSGLSGRSELSAFFLEDLLLPQTKQEN